jgi:hypothetical protein
VSGQFLWSAQITAPFAGTQAARQSSQFGQLDVAQASQLSVPAMQPVPVAGSQLRRHAPVG